jgi:hypothetical protein
MHLAEWFAEMRDRAAALGIILEPLTAMEVAMFG